MALLTNIIKSQPKFMRKGRTMGGYRLLLFLPIAQVVLNKVSNNKFVVLCNFIIKLGSKVCMRSEEISRRSVLKFSAPYNPVFVLSANSQK